MVVCEGSVTTACACANVKRAPPAARRSRFGVLAGPPYDDNASARSVSMVTSRTFWSWSAAIAKEGERPVDDQRANTAAAIAMSRIVTATARIGGFDLCIEVAGRKLS